MTQNVNFALSSIFPYFYALSMPSAEYKKPHFKNNTI